MVNFKPFLKRYLSCASVVQYADYDTMFNNFVHVGYLRFPRSFASEVILFLFFRAKLTVFCNQRPKSLEIRNGLS